VEISNSIRLNCGIVWQPQLGPAGAPFKSPA